MTANELEWTVHPMKRHRWVTILVTIFIFVVSAVVLYTTESRWFAVFAMVVMMLSLAKFYFPTHYKLDDEGVFIRTTTQKLHKPWSQYRSCYADKNGVLLSPFAEPSRMENFRGLYVMFWNNKDEVTAFVKSQIERAVASEGAVSSAEAETKADE